MCQQLRQATHKLSAIQPQLTSAIKFIPFIPANALRMLEDIQQMVQDTQAEIYGTMDQLVPWCTASLKVLLEFCRRAGLNCFDRGEGWILCAYPDRRIYEEEWLTHTLVNPPALFSALPVMHGVFIRH